MKSIDFPSYARNITTAAFTTNKQATTAPHSVKRRVYLSSSTGVSNTCVGITGVNITS